MNAQRRKEISEVRQQLEALHSRIETLAGEEQEYFDNMPENMQGGDKGTAAEEAINGLEEAASSVDDAMTCLDSIA